MIINPVFTVFPKIRLYYKVLCTC